MQATAQGHLWDQIAATLEEALLGFLIGVVLGVLFGIMLGRSHFLAEVLGQYIKAANAFPRIVLGSLFFIGLGLGIQSKIALAAVLVFFIAGDLIPSAMSRSKLDFQPRFGYTL